MSPSHEPPVTLIRTMDQFARSGVKLTHNLQAAAEHMNTKYPGMNLKIDVLLTDHLAVALWVLAILEASVSDTSKELKEFKACLTKGHAWKVLRGASHLPLGIIIQGCGKVDQEKRKELLNLVCVSSKGTWLKRYYDGAVFDVHFREEGFVNKPATFLRISSSFGSALSAVKVAVEDPSILVTNTIYWLKRRVQADVAALDKVNEENHQEQTPLRNEYCGDGRWDDLVILHLLFKLMRSPTLRRKNLAWTRAPFDEQCWDETVDTLNYLQDGQKEQWQSWMEGVAASFEQISDTSMQEASEALKYFIPFFDSHAERYRDDPDSKATFITKGAFRYPSYPGYPSVYPRYTSHPRSAFHVVAR